MRGLVRFIAFFVALVPLVFAGLLWNATGQKLFTQLPSDALAKMLEAKPAVDPFAELGTNDLAGKPEEVDNVFHLGILPAGWGNSFADSASVLSLGAPGFFLLLCLMFATRREKIAPVKA
ncbi:MAG: hypothetical protein AABZ53_02565 [Planctomycetota bacterium]